MGLEVLKFTADESGEDRIDDVNRWWENDTEPERFSPDAVALNYASLCGSYYWAYRQCLIDDHKAKGR